MLNRTILTVAVATAVGSLPVLASAASVSAKSDMELYGRAHLSVDSLNDGNDYSALNMSSNSSRFGFKGSTDFGALTGIYKIEQEIIINSGDSKDWSSRDTFAGVKGDFGMLRLGRFDTPFKSARGPANLFGDQLGDMRNMTRAELNFDDRSENTIHYQTADMNGLQFNVAYGLHEGDQADLETDDAGDPTSSTADQTVVSLSATYSAGPLNLAVAQQTWGEYIGGGDEESRGNTSALRTAASYKVMPALTLSGFYQTQTDSNDARDDADALESNTVTGFGGEYKLDDSTYVRGHFFNVAWDDLDDKDASLMAVGIEHRLDSALRVYANYATVTNGDEGSYTPWKQARTASPDGADGETATGISLGMRYDF